MRTLGTSFYTGNAYGIRLTYRTSSEFTADVALTANFRTGTINGMITGADLPSDLILGGADGNIIRDTDADNFGSFAGDTNMDDGYAGKWGGNLYGDGGTSAAGTFGVSKGIAGAEDFDSFVGFFGANELDSSALPQPQLNRHRRGSGDEKHNFFTTFRLEVL